LIIPSMDALGPFVLLHPWAEMRGGFARTLARQTFVDDIGGVVEIRAVPLAGSTTAQVGAAWRRDAERRAAIGGPEMVQTLSIGHEDGMLYEATERCGEARFSELAARSSAGDAPGLELALALTHAFASAVESIHRRGFTLGGVGFDDLTVTLRSAIRIRALDSVEGLLVAPELDTAEKAFAADDAAADTWLVGRVLKALLSGGAGDDLRPRVPTAHRPAVKELLLSMMARQRSQRPALDAASTAISRLLWDIESRSVDTVLGEALASHTSTPFDDEPKPDVVIRLRDTCALVASPPALFREVKPDPTIVFPAATERGSTPSENSGRQRTHTREESGALSPRREAPPDGPRRTVVARRKTSGSDAPSSKSASPNDDDSGLVFDDTPSGPIGRSPPSTGAAPSTDISTALVAFSDLHTAEAFASPHTGVDDDAPSLEAPFDAPAPDAGAGLRGDAADGAFTLAGLESPDLDLHVDDDIRLALPSTIAAIARTDAASKAIAPATRTIESPLPGARSADDSAVGAVWATGGDDDEPETRTDRRRRASAGFPKDADPDATLAFEGQSPSGNEAAVFANEQRARSTHIDVAPPAERTVLLDGSLEGQAQRRADTPRSRRRKAKGHASTATEDAPQKSVVVDAQAAGADDRTALLAPGIQARVLSELGSSPWPRARSEEDETLKVEDPDAARAILAAVARKAKDIAADETALLDVSSSMAKASRTTPAKGGDTGTLTVCAPRGASVYVDGKLRGTGEVVVDGVDRFRAVNVRVILDGHRPWVAEVSCGGRRAVDVHPELVRR
jgi:hypothetical protein